MKLNLLIIIILFFATSSCEREESIDPIIGTWKLVDKSVNGTFVEISECLFRSNLEFHTDNTVTFNAYFEDEDTRNCEFQSYINNWSESNGNYAVYSGSLFNQNRTLTLENSQLLYSLESWEIIGTDVIATDLVFIYEKE